MRITRIKRARGVNCHETPDHVIKAGIEFYLTGKDGSEMKKGKFIGVQRADGSFYYGRLSSDDGELEYVGFFKGRNLSGPGRLYIRGEVASGVFEAGEFKAGCIVYPGGRICVKAMYDDGTFDGIMYDGEAITQGVFDKENWRCLGGVRLEGV